MRQLSKAYQLLGLIGWLIVVFIAAACGGFASANAGTFYNELHRPTWAPPGWLFGPVWTLLYVLMGISAWLVWRTYGFLGAQTALSLFIVHLIFNALWSWLFFAWRLGAWSFVEILILWTLILGIIYLFWRFSKVASILLIPYFAWVTFASFLAFKMWRLNPSLLG